MAEAVEVAVIGGGPVGAALALALADRGCAPVVLEARDRAVAVGDPRPLALSYGSRLILDRLGVWQALAPATPIEAIHVSQRGGFGRAMLTAAEAGLPALGYVVDYARVHAILAEAAASRVSGYFAGAMVRAVIPGHDAATVEYSLSGSEHAIAAQLVVVADGGASDGLWDTEKVDYGQAAVTATVTSELAHGNVAFERFTERGPLALLPYDLGLALVWTAGADRARELCELPAAEFLAELNEQFGGRLGAFRSVGKRTVFPLALKYAREVARPRTVLIGNAAQTLHPVAGQGFNLGLRDAWELAAEIARMSPHGVGDPATLAAYRARRRIDRLGGIGFTHSLVRLFSNDIAPLGIARGIGLSVLGCLPPVKNFVARRMIFGARG